MKKLLSVLMTVVCLFMVMSCGDKPGSLEDDNKKDSFEAGWWKYTITNPTTLTNFDGDSNYYYYFDDDKNLTRAGNDTYEYTGATLELYQNNSKYSFENLKEDARINSNVTFVKITEDDLPETWIDDETPPTPPTEKQRKNSFLIIPDLETTNVNETKRIDYIGSGAMQSDDEFEILITENNDNIEVTTNAYYDYFEITAKSEGKIKIKVYNKTANCESNECEINIIGETKPGFDTITSLLIGTWTVTTQPLLFDTIEFYNDGTGKVYHTQYEGYNTFTWEIIDSNTFDMTNMLGQKGTVTYNVSATTLYLTNFFAYNAQIEAIR